MGLQTGASAGFACKGGLAVLFAQAFDQLDEGRLLKKSRRSLLCDGDCTNSPSRVRYVELAT
jgi:hypothetical protein